MTAILAVCHRLRVPVVNRGAGTGLFRWRAAAGKGVLLVMARFKRSSTINPLAAARRASQACVTWRSPRPLHRIISSTHRTLPHKSPVPLAATWQMRRRPLPEIWSDRT
ncbi:hypothetical protein ACVXHA_05730 [Escherichia coli]